MASAMPDLWTLPSQLQSITPYSWYQIILLDEKRHTCANNLLTVVTWQYTGRELNQQPHYHQSDTLHSQATPLNICRMITKNNVKIMFPHIIST